MHWIVITRKAWYDVSLPCCDARPPIWIWCSWLISACNGISEYNIYLCILLISGYFSTISVPGFWSQQLPGITGRSGGRRGSQYHRKRSFIDTTHSHLISRIHRPARLILIVHHKILLFFNFLPQIYKVSEQSTLAFKSLWTKKKIPTVLW